MSPQIKFSRESIVNTALNLVRKYGWHGLTARSIANELNSSTIHDENHSMLYKGLAYLITNSFRFDAVKTDEDFFDMIRNPGMAIFRGIKDNPDPSGIYS